MLSSWIKPKTDYALWQADFEQRQYPFLDSLLRKIIACFDLSMGHTVCHAPHCDWHSPSRPGCRWSLHLCPRTRLWTLTALLSVQRSWPLSMPVSLLPSCIPWTKFVGKYYSTGLPQTLEVSVFSPKKGEQSQCGLTSKTKSQCVNCFQFFFNASSHSW